MKLIFINLTWLEYEIIHKYTPKSVEKTVFKCIFRSTDNISRILLKNSYFRSYLKTEIVRP